MSDIGSFSSTLSYQDRMRLRTVIRKIHFAHYPTEFVTNKECDKLIDAWGPEIAGIEIRKAMNAGHIS